MDSGYFLLLLFEANSGWLIFGDHMLVCWYAFVFILLAIPLSNFNGLMFLGYKYSLRSDGSDVALGGSDHNLLF